MDADQLAEYRKKRLSDLADKYGGKKALGQALGYTDGAYVGQMIRGDRPITEKFLRQVEQHIPALAGWFAARDLLDQSARYSRVSEVDAADPDLPRGRPGPPSAAVSATGG